MIRRTITYENVFTGEQVTEEHYFHISKADLVEMEMEEHKDEYVNSAGEKLTGMQAKLQRIVDSEDGKAIMQEFKDIIRRSYGKKDGTRFRKTPEIWDEFASTEAFSQLLFELCTNATAAAEFIQGVVPNNLEQIADDVRRQAEATAAQVAESPEQAAMARAETALTNGDGDTGDASDDSAGPRLLTTQEAQAMNVSDLQSGLASGRFKLS